MDLIITEIPREKQTLCLNMIVKNEAHIIVETLKNLCHYFQFDYWVISDTGSTDNTKELIKTFFEEKYIPGEIVEHNWVDFGYNRTKALESAYNKTDYLLIFDADDSIVGNFKMTTKLTHDRYMLKFGQGFEYMRPLLINNKKKWCFKGVLHEYLESSEPSHQKHLLTEGSIMGDYFFISGRHGNRSKNPNKYYDDAMVLEKGFATEMLPDGDKGMAHRYAFYCAQSYKDSGSKYIDKSIEWYTKVLDLNNWNQEKYYSCCQLGELYKQKNDMINAVKYWLKSIDYDKERIEGVVSACEYYYNTGVHLLVNSLYERFKNYNKSLHEGKLFINQSQYKDELEYYNSISAFYANNKESGYEACKRILMNNLLPMYRIKLTIKNIMFYKEFLQKEKDGSFFYVVDNLLHELDKKNETIENSYSEVWNHLFTSIKDTILTFYNTEVINTLNNKKTVLSCTTSPNIIMIYLNRPLIQY
jgi:tetratricopeptide (TPR) repeat protein